MRSKIRIGFRADLNSLPLRIDKVSGDSIIMLCEILDDHLEQKIQSDKVIEGILKDIQGNIASIAIREEIKDTFKKD